MNSVSWYDAAAYCNWLSKQEGFPEDQWCYGPNEKGDYAEGMKLMSNPRTEGLPPADRSGMGVLLPCRSTRGIPSASLGSYWKSTGGMSRTHPPEHSLSAASSPTISVCSIFMATSGSGVRMGYKD